MRKSFRGAKSGSPDQIFQDMGSPRFAGSVRGGASNGVCFKHPSVGDARRAGRADWPDGCVRGRRQDFGRGFTLTAERGSLPWNYGGGWRRPPPLSSVSLVERYSSTTPTARPLRGLLPPPREGAGKCLAIAPDSRAMGGERIFQECQVRPRRDCQIPGHRIYGESPPWGRG